MDHVKKEVDAAKNDPKASKDWEKIQESAERLEQTVKNVQEKVSPSYNKAKDMFSKVKSAAGTAAPKPVVQESAFMFKMKETVARIAESERMSKLRESVHSGVSKVVEKGQSSTAVILIVLNSLGARPEGHRGPSQR
jgi:hypothetical protein